MKVVLTGATGFLGSHLLKKIVNDTMHEIIVLKRSFSNTKRISDYLNDKRIKYYDIDKTDISEIFSENKIDAIIHVATKYGKKNSSVEKILKTNLMFPIRLLENGVQNGCKIFINTDSYFNKEGLSYNYLLDYSLSKKSILMWLKYYSKDLKIANMVLEHIYGENDNPDKFTEFVIKNIAIDNVESINLTKGYQKRDFIYVDDVTDAYVKVLDFEEKNPDNGFLSFDTGIGKAVSIREFVEEIKNISKSTTELNFGAIPTRADEIECSIANNENLLNLGWSPKYDIKSGLQKIINIYKGQN